MLCERCQAKIKLRHKSLNPCSTVLLRILEKRRGEFVPVEGEASIMEYIYKGVIDPPGPYIIRQYIYLLRKAGYHIEHQYWNRQRGLVMSDVYGAYRLV